MPTNDLHARLAATILAQLESADPASWTPPWHGADPMPRNALTRRRYRGINVLALWCAAQTHAYTDARWATYRQWAALGAQVRKAERGTLVLFYKELPRGTEADPTDSAPFVARAAHVFNAAQVDAAPPPYNALTPSATPDPMPTFDAFVAATGAAIQHGGTRACYAPATDTIHLPPRIAFHPPTGYAGTLAHELVHWTGAPHRLARDLTGQFGARAYAAEELVAELGAAFVLADLGIARMPTRTTPPTVPPGHHCCAPTPARSRPPPPRPPAPRTTSPPRRLSRTARYRAARTRASRMSATRPRGATLA